MCSDTGEGLVGRNYFGKRSSSLLFTVYCGTLSQNSRFMSHGSSASLQSCIVAFTVGIETTNKRFTTHYN